MHSVRTQPSRDARAVAPSAQGADLQVSVTARLRALHEAVLSAQPAVCPERAVLVTRYHRRRARRWMPAIQQKAEALAYVLTRKQVRIDAGELLVGNFTSHRVGGGLFPELHGVAMLEDVFRFPKRRVNPMAITRRARWQLLLEVVPYWLTRFLPMRIRPLREAARFVADQLDPTFYLINETGGISHFVPDYAGLLARGTQGYREAAAWAREGLVADSPEADFLRAVETVCDGLEIFADRYRREAERLAPGESDPRRRAELLRIAEICAQVPRRPARGLQEALQSILFAQIALNLESLDNSVCPGRLDQVLWPYYQSDVERGRLDAQGAFELLGCFAVKLCEVVPVFSERLTRFHGGLFNGQVVVVGGTDQNGDDATNELTTLFLELMDQLRTRQPNYHARLHPGAPTPYRRRIARALASGAVSPALYNDAVIVPTLTARGVSLPHARDYATVGCVEPAAAGRSFFSTDAALLNLALCLELALNEGRRFGSRRRIGAKTAPVSGCRSIDDVMASFRKQVEHVIDRLIADLRTVEGLNARFHPTPLTSMLIDGCLENRRDASEGGARYNGSGVQGVGVVEVGDSLAALDDVVFSKRVASLEDVVRACIRDFDGCEDLRARLRAAPKYGNDDATADRFAASVMRVFAQLLGERLNTRGGRYVAGYYSVTAHEAFGRLVGALPSGRSAGEAFSSGISPVSGFDRKGPTAALLSAARLPLHLAPNGVNFNLQLPPWAGNGDRGARVLQGLIDGGFAAGCMQMQVNVLDPAVLIEARDHPGRYPGLLVRVSGYSAYFDDLSPEMKDEMIRRWSEDLAET